MNYKYSSDISYAITQINNANSKLEDAYGKLKYVRSSIDTGVVMGESKNVIDALLEICDIYHKGIMENVNKEAKAVKTFNQEVENYMSKGRIPRKWR